MSAGAIAVLATKRDELLERQPPWDPMMGHVLEAWNILDGCRSIGMVVGSIPWTAVIAWCDRQPWCDAELAEIITHAINYLDADRGRKSVAKPPPAPSPKSRQ